MPTMTNRVSGKSGRKISERCLESIRQTKIGWKQFKLYPKCHQPSGLRLGDELTFCNSSSITFYIIKSWAAVDAHANLPIRARWNANVAL